MRRRAPIPAIAALLLAVLPAAACSVVEPPTYTRGNRVDPDQLKELIVGTSSKADATSLLGSPTAHATFDDNRWIYVGEVTQPRIGRYPDVLSQDVVVLTFDQGGVLRNIQHLTEKNAQQVAMAPGATPSPGSEASFLQQLLGNVGRFSPGGLGSTGGGGGGAGGAPGL